MGNQQAVPLIVNQTVSTATAISLRERILRGDFEEGQPLLQDVLAAEYGVSRIPLREALRQLESEGLVTSIPHRGCMVAVLSPEEAVELCEIRALVECDVLTHAVPNMTDDHFDRAQDVLDKTNELLIKNADEFECGPLIWEFRSILYGASKRKRSLKLISSLHNSPDRSVRLQAFATVGLKRIHQKQSEILKLCRQGKTKEAVSALKEIMNEVADVLKIRIRAKQMNDNNIC